MDFTKFTERRKFLSNSVKFGALLAATPVLTALLSSCTSIPIDQDWSKVEPGEFDIDAFNRWYKWNDLYQGINPNLNSPHRGGEHPSFRASIFSSYGATPGLDYSVPSGEIMVSSAPGSVSDALTLRTGRAGGKMVRVSHPVEFYLQDNVPRWSFFNTFCAHLDEVFVKIGQKVDRNAPIGRVGIHKEYAKIMIKEGGNFSNPDLFGHNNDFMRYPEDAPVDDDEDRKSIKYTNELLLKQQKTLMELDSHRHDYEDRDIGFMHIKKGRRATNWSTPDKFRYLVKLRKVQPQQFPNLSDDEFNSISERYSKYQPLILTLPWRKGGFRG